MPNSWVEHCYMRVNCNDLRIILCILVFSILSMHLVLEWSTCKLHTWSAYTCKYPTLTHKCPTHTSDHTCYISFYEETSKSYKMWLGLQKSTISEHKKCQFLVCLLYHNLITIYTTATKSSSLLQKVMGFLLQFMEMG